MDIKTIGLFIGLFTAGICSANAKQAKIASINGPACQSNNSKLERKIREKFNNLWESVDKTVGLEFFMVVLRNNDRMPASSTDGANYYRRLLAGMNMTTIDLSDHGAKFEEKDVIALQKLIDDLKTQQLCKLGKISKSRS